MVGDDECVLAEGFAVFRSVLEQGEEPFLGEQAFQKGEIAFVVLQGHAALGVGGGVGEIPAPLGSELAQPFPVGKPAIEANSLTPKVQH